MRDTAAAVGEAPPVLGAAGNEEAVVAVESSQMTNPGRPARAQALVGIGAGARAHPFLARRLVL